MNKTETAKILSIISATYPQVKIKNGTVEAWHVLLGDLSFDIVLSSIKKVLQEQEYPTIPTIGKIRKEAVFLSTPHHLPAPKAWALIISAVRRYGYSQEKEALEDMPELVKEAVKSIGWRDICLSENIDVIRGQFRMAYDRLQQKQEELNIVSPDIKELVINNQKAIGG